MENRKEIKMKTKKLATLILTMMIMIAQAGAIYGTDTQTPAATTTETEEQAMAGHILELVNQQRAAAGLQPLTWDSHLEDCATVRAVEASQRFGHTRPDGSQWYTIDPVGMNGENLAYGYKTAEAAVTAWMNSPTHAFNILYPDFKRCSIAIYKSGNVLYYAQEFGL